MGLNLRAGKAAQVMRDGGVVAYPTESVYGLGCDPLDPTAISRILDLKQRDPEVGFIILGADLADVRPYLDVSDAQLQAMQAEWPGPVTWVAPCAPDVPAWLTGGRETIAVRVTAHPGAAAVCRAFGRGILSTSANRSGRPPAKTALQVRLRFDEKAIDYVLPGPTGGAVRPTEIREAVTGRVLRAG